VRATGNAAPCYLAQSRPGRRHWPGHGPSASHRDVTARVGPGHEALAARGTHPSLRGPGPAGPARAFAPPHWHLGEAGPGLAAAGGAEARRHWHAQATSTAPSPRPWGPVESDEGESCFKFKSDGPPIPPSLTIGMFKLSHTRTGTLRHRDWHDLHQDLIPRRRPGAALV
jgi:hypothetical protein